MDGDAGISPPELSLASEVEADIERRLRWLGTLTWVLLLGPRSWEGVTPLAVPAAALAAVCLVRLARSAPAQRVAALVQACAAATAIIGLAAGLAFWVPVRSWALLAEVFVGFGAMALYVTAMREWCRRRGWSVAAEQFGRAIQPIAIGAFLVVVGIVLLLTMVDVGPTPRTGGVSPRRLFGRPMSGIAVEIGVVVCLIGWGVAVGRVRKAHRTFRAGLQLVETDHAGIAHTR